VRGHAKSGWESYQIADDNLAVTVGGGRLCRNGLCASTASGLRVLLDTSDRRGWGGASSGTARVVATASAAVLGLSDVLKSLVELARHCVCWCENVGEVGSMKKR
jgi:hypothetical protein